MTWRVPRRRTFGWFYPWRGVDWLLLGAVWATTVIGAVFIHSSQLHLEENDSLQHLLVGGMGTMLALILARVPESVFMGSHWVIYGLSCALLLAVDLVGVEAKGAERWLAIGGFNLQPSEFAKISLILTQAALLHRISGHSLKGILSVFAATAPPFSWF